MNENLIKQFEDVIVKETDHSKDDEILWLEDEHHNPIGFLKAKLTKKEMILLEMLFNPYESIQRPKLASEKKWADYLFAQGNQPNDPKWVQFIHFSLEKRIEDYNSFRDVWESIFSSPIMMLWTTPTRGMIIVDVSIEEELPDFHSINQAISSDFYVDITLLVGTKHVATQSLSQFSWENACLEAIIDSKVIRRVFFEHEAVPYFLLQSIPTDQRKLFLSRLIDDDLRDDKEFLKSIAVYFEHNLNISAAAKTLHMHRNSLQYRIDKYMERTTFDLRQFPQATLMYIALLLLDQRS
ncbi:PucR family transcriptional regulator [Bacillus suaedae]|uniref:Helix-turn-helix domain-containing protein n=1 Tax=Halalkalibacter suaedae TaxID=2822140 RepID=A0A940WVY8_9BACI|nr:helix-turn-helix domain-containing protein [Bacillus suaedae]MBP3951472.1 helix-turn-helix domain-containing protein [Bacillus suaedae]